MAGDYSTDIERKEACTLSCSAGRYRSGYEGTGCTNCPVGYMQSATGKPYCTMCIG
jgi:hypothetical protein